MESIQIQDFLSFKFLSNMQTSPAKTQMTFAVASPNEKKNEYLYDLYLSDGDRHQKLLPIKNKANYIWETDQTLLIQYARIKSEEKIVKEEKKTIYYRYSLVERKLEKAYTFDFPATILKVLSDQKLLLSAQLIEEEHRLYTDDEASRKKYLEEAKKAALYEDIEEIPFYFNGQGFIANVRNQLFLYDIETKIVIPLVSPDFNVGAIRISDDLKHVYFSGQIMTGVRQLTSNVYVYHVDTKTVDTLYDNSDLAIANIYLLHDKVILAAKDMKTYGINQNVDFYWLKDKQATLFNLYRGSLGNSVGTDVRLGAQTTDQIDQNKLYFVATVDDHNELHALDQAGNLTIAYRFKGTLEGFVVLKDTFYGISLYKQKLQEIYAIDLINQTMVQKTRFNQKALKNTYVAAPKTVTIKKPTHEIKGFVLFPKDYDPKKRYPLILDIHGGPKTVYGPIYYHEMQVWANKGYFVIFANPRGSDGKGDAFADIRGKYGTIDYEDLMDFTDHVLRRIPQIDASNMFVTGGSYGGFMTNWIIGHTNRFKAAVTQRSISNWLSFHGTSDIGFYFSKDQTAGHPVYDTEKLWEQSPIKYADRMTTPLLIIHSDQDYRCPIEQGMQLFTVLKEKGVPTKMVWFKGENHELSRSGKPQARIKRLNDITTWFEQYTTIS